MSIRYYMQYLKTANVNLIKDMGMIPYKLHKLYGFDSTVVTYKIGEYDYLNNEVKGLKIDFVRKIFHSYSLDGCMYLVKNSKKIDILQLFHCTLSSVAYAYIYKLINKQGKIYLKLDCSHKLVERIKGLSKLKLLILNKFLAKIDLISVEQEELFNDLKLILKEQVNKIINIPNGVDYDKLKEYGIEYDYSIKENIILNVARIGAEEKNTMMLLEAFAGIRDITQSDWTLKLIGSIDEGFKEQIQKYFLKYPKLKDKIIFAGAIVDRNELYKEYAKAKIFSLTSDFESFGIAFIEAAALGDVIISTDVGIAKELLTKDNGKVVHTGDIEGLTKAFEQFIYCENIKEYCSATAEICKNKFDWNSITHRLHDKLRVITKTNK